jgi:hypothetical protein
LTSAFSTRAGGPEGLRIADTKTEVSMTARMGCAVCRVGCRPCGAMFVPGRGDVCLDLLGGGVSRHSYADLIDGCFETLRPVRAIVSSRQVVTDRDLHQLVYGTLILGRQALEFVDLRLSKLN